MRPFGILAVALFVACVCAGCATSDRMTVDNVRVAAERGDRDAQTALGGLYLFGNKGVERNDAEAVRWLRMAAEQGQALAQFDMGELHRTGRGVAKDEVAAVNWFRRSAMQGNAFGQSNYGSAQCLGFGGLKPDKVSCAMWLNLSAAQGFQPEKLRDLESRMTAQEIAEATRLAREWKAIIETPGKAPAR